MLKTTTDKIPLAGGFALDPAKDYIFGSEMVAQNRIQDNTFMLTQGSDKKRLFFDNDGNFIKEKK
jgi:hypothetical protein